MVIALPSAPNKGAFGGINHSVGVAEIRLQNLHLRKHNAAVLKYFKKPSSIVGGSSNEDIFDR